MAKQHIIETLGSVYKEEKLRNLNHSIIENTFVLETLEPYPGYHGTNMPPTDSQKTPYSVFFIFKNWYSTEHIFRMTRKIKKYFKKPFDATPAELKVYNFNFDALRIKDLESYDYLQELQQCFRDEGFLFAKPKKVDTKGIMKIKKYLLIEQKSDTIYYDTEDDNMAYLEIPVNLSWKQFEEITHSIRRNIDYKKWDAAMGVIFRKSALIDMVRIYDPDCSMENLEMLHAKYLNEIQRFYM